MPDNRVLEYIVDGANRRIAKKVDGVITKGFLYEGSLRIAAELDGVGNVVSRFVYATGVNVPEYMNKGGVTYRIVTDHLGSVRMVVDVATGVVAQEMQYDEFGVVELDTNPGFTPFGFAGGLYDADTRLTRFGARDYDAETGRWTVKDPIGFGGGDTNLYGYVLGDPVNLIDPSGLKDTWYGYNDKNFQDWMHDQKPDINRGPKENFSQEEVRAGYAEWIEDGKPRGKGGKSGKGGQSKKNDQCERKPSDDTGEDTSSRLVSETEGSMPPTIFFPLTVGGVGGLGFAPFFAPTPPIVVEMPMLVF